MTNNFLIIFCSGLAVERRLSNEYSGDMTGSADDPACLFPENLACCDCKSEVGLVSQFSK